MLGVGAALSPSRLRPHPPALYLFPRASQKSLRGSHTQFPVPPATKRKATT
jgi:hypothetical protein